MLITAPFYVAALMVYFGANPYAAIAVSWFIMMAIIRGLTTSGGVLGEE